ncbi:MAG TPA: LytTR family DNA-binding domain-containing protein [Acidobacteriota bacterium]|jgi:two-component system LytT family response regulator
MSHKIRALLVDDEQPARERLRQLLRFFEDVEIVSEAEDGEQAIEKTVEFQPDLLFLDIQMPGCSGMEVVASLPAPRPKIIFCTAYDQYAIDAFELYAIDYLLKPVSRARLAQALERVRQESSSDTERMLDNATQPSRGGTKRFLAKRGSKFRVVPQDEVVYFASEEGLTKLCTQDQHYWMEPTLTDLEGRLDAATFCRISRSTIVNLNTIHEVLPLPGGHAEVLLKNGIRLEVSRRRLKDLLNRFEGT